MRPYLVDLHVHTVLSACAEVEMIPPFVVARARELGLGMIAVTDHNSAENVEAVMQAADGKDLVVLPGMEVQSREEVHLLCLFDDLETVLDWQEYVYAHLPPLRNREEVFGAQFVMDATGEFVRYNERLLLTSTTMSVEEITEGVVARHGICIPAHVDRPSFSLLTTLGFVPETLDFPALELSRHGDVDDICRRFPSVMGHTFISSGDAHRLEEMRDGTILTIASPTIQEIEMALRGQLGRRVRILSGKPTS